MSSFFISDISKTEQLDETNNQILDATIEEIAIQANVV
jgi:hypothetical protein